MKNQDFFSDYFLIASPTLEDPHFKNTVSYICHHDEKGAKAVVINRLLQHSFSELLGHLDIPARHCLNQDVLVGFGGPVDRHRGFVVHGAPFSWAKTLEIPGSDLAITVSLDILKAIAVNEGPDPFWMTLGYAGWSAQQLEKEIAEGFWLLAPAKNAHHIIFHTPVEKRWAATLRLLNMNPVFFSGEVGHA